MDYYYKSEEEIREENIRRGWANNLMDLQDWNQKKLLGFVNTSLIWNPWRSVPLPSGYINISVI